MKIELSVEDIRGLVRVDVTSDQKGNPVGVLEIMGQPVLFAPEGHVLNPGSDFWEGVVTDVLAHHVAKLLLNSPSMEGWSLHSPTGREVHRL